MGGDHGDVPVSLLPVQWAGSVLGTVELRCTSQYVPGTVRAEQGDGSHPKVPYGPSYNGLPSNLMLRLGGFLGRE